jgi:hypothetical protein
MNNRKPTPAHFLTFSLALLLLFTGCSTTPKRTAYNTLASVHTAVDAAFDSYLDLVVNGKVKRDSLPRIARAYDDFQITFRAAVLTARMASGSGTVDGTLPAPIAGPDVVLSANIVLSEIAAASKP